MSYVNSPGTFLANAAISAFRAVALSSNRGVGANGNTTTPMGFTLQDAAASEYVAVRFIAGPGTHKCIVTGAPITVGDTVYAAGSGFVSATGTVALGKSLNTATANDTIIEFVPTL